MDPEKLVFHEDNCQEKDSPGRKLRWLIKPDITGNEHCSVNMVRLAPGAVVTPAHSHPEEEEVIYIVEGKGEVMIDDRVYPLRTGSVAIFPPKSVHMLKNSEESEMKVICFFSPAADTTMYKFHEEIRFPDN